MTNRIRIDPQSQSRRDQGGAVKAEVKRQKAEVEAAGLGFIEATPPATFLFLDRFAIRPGQRSQSFGFTAKAQSMQRFGNSDGRSARLPSVKYHRRLACLLLNAERR